MTMEERKKPDPMKPTKLSGPIIQTSFDGDLTERTGSYLAEKYGEKLIRIDQFDFRKTDPHHVRFTFWGHGKQTAYAGLTPQEFARALIKKCHLLEREPKVEVIDLLGCEIGFIAGKKSYVLQVAEELYKAGYTGKINAFTNLSSMQTPIVSNMQIGVQPYVAENFLVYKLLGIPEKKQRKI